MDAFPNRFFVTGTDTGVGKTVVSSVLCSGLRAGYWKPVQAGTEPMTDTEQVRSWTGLPESHFYPEQSRLKAPMSPHAAAEREGVLLHLDDFRLPACRQNHLVVEGAGGVLVPLNRTDYMTDLIRFLDLPVLLVARSGLGTINHTLLSLICLRKLEIELFGVVLNGPRNSSNEDAVRHFGQVERLYTLEPVEDLTPSGFTRSFERTFG